MTKILSIALGITAVMAGCVPGGLAEAPPPGTFGAAPVDPNVDVPAPSQGGLEPDEPGPSDVLFSIDATRSAHPISPYVYGVNSTNPADPAAKARHLPFIRVGGNRLTAFDWENNASNAGVDWNHQSDALLGASDAPGESAHEWVSAAHAADASVLMTLPMAGYVAADKGPAGDVNQTPDYLTSRFHQTAPRKGSAFAYPPDKSDGQVYQDEFVAWLEQQFPEARADSTRTIFYSLDNEPDLWSETHPRIHESPVTYAQLGDKSKALAAAVKDVAPEALVFGPASYGWAGYLNLQNASDAGGRDFLDWYLDEMRAAERSGGQRLLDVLDLHWYPEAQGGGQRVTSASADPAVAAARVQAPRSLWDPSYTETSWIGQLAGPIRLIPRMREKISSHYPGTGLAITEYNYGGGGDISGGLAQADALGVFGRERLFAASLWELAADQQFIYGALAMFRNYDGQGAHFGDLSIEAGTSSNDQSSVYASVDSSDPTKMVVVAINKTTAPLSAAFQIKSGHEYRSAAVYSLTSTSPQPQPQSGLSITGHNAFVLSLPAMSVITLELG
ncbi:MAG: endoglucanase A [Deltaproteobacteria bacterium]|nr:endoglucanase A [Deltaproteobacteria bacterium]